MKILDNYNIAHISLREYLLPIDKWREDFMKMECSGEFSFELPPLPEHIISRPYYIMPYPYVYPAWLEIIKKSGRPVAIDDIRDDWVKALTDRYTRCLYNAVSEDVVAGIDGVYGLGAMVVRSTGQVVPFDYSEITGVRLEMFPAETESIAMEVGGDADDKSVDMMCDMLDELYGLCDLHYSLIYGPHVTREISEAEKFQCRFPGRVFLDLEDISVLGVYINQMIGMRAKVIPLI